MQKANAAKNEKTTQIIYKFLSEQRYKQEENRRKYIKIKNQETQCYSSEFGDGKNPFFFQLSPIWLY